MNSCQFLSRCLLVATLSSTIAFAQESESPVRPQSHEDFCKTKGLPPNCVIVLPPPVSPRRLEHLCPTRSSPVFPREALFNDISGTVVVKVRIAQGEVAEVIEITGPKVFHAAVSTALATYRCQHSETPVIASQSFTFKVETTAPPASAP